MRQKTNTVFWIVFWLLFPVMTFSQENFKSFIYNDNGQLRIDTTLNISQDQFDIWNMSESNILGIISISADYSKIALANGIQGIVIVSFDCDTTDLNNIKILKSTGGPLYKNVIKIIEKKSKHIVYEFRHIQNLRKNDPIKYLGTYYIPFDFSLINLNEEMKKRNAIPMFGLQIPLIGRWMH
jgi:hypothetical protein